MLNIHPWRRASGSDPAQQPSNWLSSADGSRFVSTLTEILDPRNSGIIVGKSHNNLVETRKRAGTFAHWQVGLAYAKYLSPPFHMWCNEVVREHMEGRAASQPASHLPENRGLQVVTYETIDKVHQRPKGTAKDAVVRNKARFFETEDFYDVSRKVWPSEIPWPFEKQAPTGRLVTKRGYLKIAKTLGDEKASICDRRHPERKRYDHVMRDINRLPQIGGSPRRSTVVVGEGVLGFKEPSFYAPQNGQIYRACSDDFRRRNFASFKINGLSVQRNSAFRFENHELIKIKSGSYRKHDFTCRCKYFP